MSKCLAPAILTGRYRLWCLGSEKMRKVCHVDIAVNYELNVALCWFTWGQKYLFIYILLSSKYCEPHLTIKTSFVKTDLFVHIVKSVTCSEQWNYVDLQQSVQLSSGSLGAPFQRCYLWADILRFSSLWHFIN